MSLDDAVVAAIVARRAAIGQPAAKPAARKSTMRSSRAAFVSESHGVRSTFQPASPVCAGASAFLSKPLQDTSLLAAIESATRSAKT